jgi:hypothetical protein
LSLPTILVDSLWSAGKFLLTVIPLFVLGVLLAQLLVEFRWLEKLSWLAQPLTKFGHLHPECTGSFIVAVISPTAGHSMLAEFYAEKRIRRSELIIAAIVNALPGYIAQGRSLLPVTIPLIGVLGIYYYGLILFADLLKSAVLLGIGCFLLPKRDSEGLAPRTSSGKPKPAWRDAFRNALQSARKTVPKILKTMIPMTIGVYILINLGIFEYAARHLGFVARILPVRVEALPIVATRLASPIGAYTMAGSLLSKGVLRGEDVLRALFAGTLLATVPNIRYLIPYYFGIFGPSVGVRLVLVSTILRVLVFTAVLGLMALLI